ncbi:unnamed protein product [Brassica oleracea var. botrytis]
MTRTNREMVQIFFFFFQIGFKFRVPAFFLFWVSIFTASFIL